MGRGRSPGCCWCVDLPASVTAEHFSTRSRDVPQPTNTFSSSSSFLPCPPVVFSHSSSHDRNTAENPRSLLCSDSSPRLTSAGYSLFSEGGFEFMICAEDLRTSRPSSSATWRCLLGVNRNYRKDRFQSKLCAFYLQDAAQGDLVPTHWVSEWDRHTSTSGCCYRSSRPTMLFIQTITVELTRSSKIGLLFLQLPANSSHRNVRTRNRKWTSLRMLTSAQLCRIQSNTQCDTHSHF